MQPNVSIVIPTFNRSRLLVNAIESALQQTYRDFEIIVVDDGSTDDTVARLRPYAGRIRYHYQENQGASAAQNKGIALARAPWISILASDDLWLPTKLESQFKAVAELGAEFGACFTDCVYMGDPRRTASAFEQAGLECSSVFTEIHDPLRFVLGRHPALYVQSLLVSRAALERSHSFDEQLVVGEDTDLMFRLAFHTRFCAVRAPLVKIDRNPSRDRGLVELFDEKDDRIFSCIERRYLKWLAMPELTNLPIRGVIQENLRLLYYGWAIARLYDFRFAAAIESVRWIHETGHSFPRIVGVLVWRAARKLSATLGSRPEDRGGHLTAPRRGAS